MAATPDGKGYWMAGADGGVYAFGDAGFYNSLPGLGVTPNAPIVGMAATPDGKGYWLVGADGGVFAFGDAGYDNSLPGEHVTPNKPIVGIARTNNGAGYWMTGADGGVYAFGDAGFYGSMGGVTLNAPVVGMTTDVVTGGYWLGAQDGGIFSFNAPFHGSVGGSTCPSCTGPGQPPSTPSTNYDWADMVLQIGGWPVSTNNVTVITQWMTSEEPTSDWYDRNNPLNNGYGSGGGAGLGSYPNLQVAAYDVVANLNAGTRVPRVWLRRHYGRLRRVGRTVDYGPGHLGLRLGVRSLRLRDPLVHRCGRVRRRATQPTGTPPRPKQM